MFHSISTDYAASSTLVAAETLPVADTLAAPIRLLSHSMHQIDQRPHQGKHIALFANDAETSDVLARFLRVRNYRVWVTDTVAATQSLLQQRMPDIMLIDFTSSELNGVDFVRTLRQHRRTTLLPIIIISDRVTARDIRNGLAIGADDYVTKPVELGVIEARINALLRREMRLRAALSLRAV